MHSYATPAILVMPIESVDQGYLDWLMAETASRPAKGSAISGGLAARSGVQSLQAVTASCFSKR